MQVLYCSEFPCQEFDTNLMVDFTLTIDHKIFSNFFDGTLCFVANPILMGKHPAVDVAGDENYLLVVLIYWHFCQNFQGALWVRFWDIPSTQAFTFASPPPIIRSFPSYHFHDSNLGAKHAMYLLCCYFSFNDPCSFEYSTELIFVISILW